MRRAAPRALARGTLVALLAACALHDAVRAQPAARAGAQDGSPHARAAEERSAERRWKAAGEVCVRLARFESRSELAVRGARGREGSLAVLRRGGALFVDDRQLTGPDPAAPPRELLVLPADPEVGLAVDGRRYRGRLRVRAGAESGLEVDNLLDLEDYVAGVVAGEVRLLGASPAELEAQAIASRSFALAQLEARGARSLEVRLYDGTRDQVYVGVFEPTREPRSRQAARDLAAAVEATRGMTLVERGETLDARFHAACGGRTAAAADVCPEAARFLALASVECAACMGGLGPRPSNAGPAADLSWRVALDRGHLERLARAFGLGSSLTSITPLAKDRGGRWLQVELAGEGGRKRASFEAVRRELQEGAIASNLVLVALPRPGEPIDGSLMLVGRGRGHGVGLCQNGCREEAARGATAAQILARYYPGSSLVDGRN